MGSGDCTKIYGTLTWGKPYNIMTEPVITAANVLDEIKRANKMLTDALERKSAADIADLYSAEGMLLPIGYLQPIQGREDLLGFWQKAIDKGIAKADLNIVDIEVHNNTAIELGNYVLLDSNNEQLDRGKYVIVWKNRGGQWMLHKDIWNSILD
jgi:ketosteroid isomerase-like protein